VRILEVQGVELEIALKYTLVRPLHVFLLIFLMSMFGILTAGISHVNARVSPVEGAPLPRLIPATVYVVGEPLHLQPTPVTFPTATATPAEPFSTAVPFEVVPVSSGQGLVAFIHAPTGLQPQPFVILSAFEAAPGYNVEIRGVENLREFICTGSPCALPLMEDSTVRFRAYSSSGDESNEVIARVRVDFKDGGYEVVVDSVSQFSIFRDSCSTLWGVSDRSEARWPQFVDSPFLLNTDKTLHLLAARLIANGIVDASDCPGGGITAGSDYPTGCGIERARSAMTEWQNQYDFVIWTTSLDTGIPPRVLKSLIEYESQFWPGNERFYLDEIGLGQINQVGIDTLLRQNPDFYNKVCPTVYSDCTRPYTSLDPAVQAIIRTAVMTSIDAKCPDCEYNVDLSMANQSIPLIAQLLKSNCQLVDYLDLAGKPSVEYEDLWKYTFATYHSGFTCVRDAVLAAKKDGLSLDWDTVSPTFVCKNAKPYVDGYWGTLLSFDSNLVDASTIGALQVAPTFLPTATPIPPPTAIPSTASARVRVYLDVNKNGQPENIELLDGIAVELLLENGKEISGVTLNGELVFDLAGYPPGMNAIVSLPGLYREKLFSIPEEGVVQVDFVFGAPEVPQELP
jgi:hypothetical protein